MTKIKIKNSTTASGVPISGTLLQGELAVNIADKRIYIGNASGNPVELGGSITAVATGSVSGVYINTSTIPNVFTLQPNVFVSGALHVSGVIAQSPASLNLYASEDPVTNLSRMINMKSYANNYGEINVTDDGTLSLSSTSNIIELRPSGVSTVQLDSSASTGYIFLTPTNIYIGGSSAVTTLPGGIISTTTTSGSVFNDTALRVNIGGGASGVQIGHPTGTVVMGNIAVNSGTISTTAATATLFDATATTVTIGSAATTTNIGAITGNQTINIGAGNSAVFTTKTINIGTNGIYGSISNVNIGSANNGGIVTVNGTLAVSSGTITTANSTGNIFNAGTARVNIGGGASGVQIGHPTGTVVMGNVSANGYVSAASGYRLTSSAVNAQTGTTYTLLSTDDGRIITMNNGSSITVTVPTGLNIGFNTTVIQLGAGQVTFATGVGSPTLNSYGSAQKITGQYGAASIISYASNSYNLAGTLST